MSSSTTTKELLSLDLLHTTRAIVSWRKDDTTQLLTEPDPKSSAITLNTRFNREAAFFELRVPVKLKGLKNATNALLRVCASSITSLEVVKNPTVPTAIKEALESTVLGLNFTLKYSPTIIVHPDVHEPLCPIKTPSGRVVDAIRDLSKATTLSIYIKARETPSRLQQISDAVSQGLFKSYSTEYDIDNLYGGNRGKIINFSSDTAAPPSYKETTSCQSPPPPSIDSSRNKRRRRDTEAEDGDIALLWAEVRAIKKVQMEVVMKEIPSRLEALETENRQLKQRNIELAEGIDGLKERCDALENDVAARQSEHENFAEMCDCSFSELTQITDGLQETVAFVNEEQVRKDWLKVIKKVVIKEIVARLELDEE